MIVAAEKIHIDRFLSLAKDCLVLDVRSPIEYRHAHIPGACNLPLFTDEERKIVGTAYKQQGRKEAIDLGLEFFVPKMKRMVEDVAALLKERCENGDSRLLIHCWRGGMRSEAVAWLMDLYGYRVFTLAGGYKRFRNYVLDTFRRRFRFKILGGYTGSGKTGILKTLEARGERIVDLEEMACHKGSAFGNIGLPPQPTKEMFENLLAARLNACWPPAGFPNVPDTECPDVWLEDESQRIGQVNIPNDLWKTMRSSPVYFLDIPFEERLRHLVEEYGGLNRPRMLDAIGRIRERLGGLNAQNATRLLEEGNVTECFRILLTYYDKAYFKSLHNREDLNSLLHVVRSASVTHENANQLLRRSRLSLQKL